MKHETDQTSILLRPGRNASMDRSKRQYIFYTQLSLCLIANFFNIYWKMMGKIYFAAYNTNIIVAYTIIGID